MASLQSVDGNLQSMFSPADTDVPRSQGYTPVEIGEPLVVRYLYLYLRLPDPERANELMVSTFVKTTEERAAAAEAVNYFNPTAKAENDTIRITDFGAQHYGHELIYYSNSYLGQSVRLTTKVMELDSPNSKLFKAVKDGIKTVAGLPFFVEYLPFAALASTGLSLFERIWRLVDRDDPIIGGEDIDLHFNRLNDRRLQSGRIVCIPGKKDQDFMNGNFTLGPDNKLLTSGSTEYTDNSYFVLQVNRELHKEYDDFNYYQAAAELLRKTNRGGDPAEFVSTTVKLFEGANDLLTIRDIEDLRFDANDPEVRKKIKALERNLTGEMRVLAESRIKQILGEE